MKNLFLLVFLLSFVFVQCAEREIPSATAEKILLRIKELGNAKGKNCIDAFKVEDFHRSAAKDYGFSNSEWATFVSDKGKKLFTVAISNCIKETKMPKKKKKKKKKKR